MRNPNRSRQFTIACVSSLQRAPRRTTGLLARAARIKARFVRLFEPGRTTVASVRPLGGTISIRSGSMVRELCVARAASATGQSGGPVGSIRLDACKLEHARPFVDFLCNHIPELDR